MPGLAREQHNDKQRQLLEERQKVAAQRTKEKEEKARKIREDKILAKQKKEEEEREQGLKLNYTFKPPPVPVGEMDGLELDLEDNETGELRLRGRFAKNCSLKRVFTKFSLCSLQTQGKAKRRIAKKIARP